MEAIAIGLEGIATRLEPIAISWRPSLFISSSEINVLLTSWHRVEHWDKREITNAIMMMTHSGVDNGAAACGICICIGIAVVSCNSCSDWSDHLAICESKTQAPVSAAATKRRLVAWTANLPNKSLEISCETSSSRLVGTKEQEAPVLVDRTG